MNIVDRVKNIIMTPKTEWPVIAAEEPIAGNIIMTYVLPLVLVPSVAHIIGAGLLGQGSSFSLGIALAIVTFISALVGIYLTSFIVDFLAPNFGSQKNFGRAVQLVAYSYTPSWVAGIFYIIPALGILVLIAGLYGLYLLYLGLPHMMKTPQEKVVPYLVVTIIVVIVVTLVLAALFTAIIFGLFGLSALSSMSGM